MQYILFFTKNGASPNTQGPTTNDGSKEPLCSFVLEEKVCQVCPGFLRWNSELPKAKGGTAVLW